MFVLLNSCFPECCPFHKIELASPPAKSVGASDMLSYMSYEHCLEALALRVFPAS